MVFLDTSVVVAFYIPESLSPRVQELFSSDMPLAICSLTQVEFCSAVARLVRMKTIDKQSGQRVVATFQDHVDQQFYSFCPITQREYDLARTWLGLFQTSLRTLDCLQLAVAHGHGLPLVTADKALVNAARQLDVNVQTL